MLWVDEEKLKAAVDAFHNLSSSLMTAGTRLRVKPPTLDDRAVEALLLAAIASQMRYPTAVFPENTYLLHQITPGKEGYTVEFPPRIKREEKANGS